MAFQTPGFNYQILASSQSSVSLSNLAEPAGSLDCHFFLFKSTTRNPRGLHDILKDRVDIEWYDDDDDDDDDDNNNNNNNKNNNNTQQHPTTTTPNNTQQHPTTPTPPPPPPPPPPPTSG
jgi:hypothetical protein